MALGRPGIDRAAADAALAFARLDRLAPARGAAPVGEGELGLSGGEAQRLAIARAAADPDARLILADEPTAHLNAATAAEVTDRLLALAAAARWSSPPMTRVWRRACPDMVRLGAIGMEVAA